MKKNKIKINYIKGSNCCIKKNGEIFNFPCSFRVRPRAITKFLNNEKLTNCMSVVIYKRYIISQEWENKKKQYKKDKCEICGSVEKLSLHHLNYKNILFESIDDVATLCKYCHYSCHFDFNKTNKLRYPSKAISRIINRMRNGNRLKRTAFSLFLRRRYIAKYGSKNVPEFGYFVHFFRKNIQYKEYPFNNTIEFI